MNETQGSVIKVQHKNIKLNIYYKIIKRIIIILRIKMKGHFNVTTCTTFYRLPPRAQTHPSTSSTPLDSQRAKFKLLTVHSAILEILWSPEEHRRRA